MADDTRQSRSSDSSAALPDEPIVAFQGYKAPDDPHDSRYAPKSSGTSSSTTSFEKLRSDLGYSNPQFASETTTDSLIVKRPPTPFPSANELPGGTAHTAGGEKLEDKNMLVDAVKSVRLDGFLTVHKQPCARDGFVMGIAGGVGTGALMWVVGRPIPKAANWAMAAFVSVSFAAYETCNYKRKVERRGVQKMHDVMLEKKQKALEQKQVAKEQADERRRELDEAWRRRPWWRKWDRGEREG